MKNLSILVALICLAGIAGCGQKGPLFLPGNPSEMRPQPPETEESGENEDDDEDEDDEENSAPPG
jgi:predicted small lipoprotein YifL